MKLLISFMAAVSLGLTCTVLGGNNYSALAAQGYRWVAINGPYACITEQDAKRMATQHTDATELQVVENIECYYLIPGAIVQLIKEDPARGISEIRIGSITRPLWTYSRFLSKRPVKDTYGVIETPESSGLIPAADRAIVPASPANHSTPRSRPDEDNR
jgi:hypothetical protein